MTDPADAPRRRRRAADAPPPVAGSATRGIVLVVAALVVGLVLLRDDTGVSAVGPLGADTAVDDGADSADGADADGDGDTSSTTAPTLRPESSVKVLVANGSGVNGAAGSVTEQLIALGYLTATPTNANGRVQSTVIYYVTGYEGEATRLATSLNAAPTAVTLMPTPAPVAQLEESQLLVVLGPDLAPQG